MEFYHDEYLNGRLSPCPVTPGDSILDIKPGNLSDLSRADFINVILAAKKPAKVLKTGTGVQRVALVATGDSQLRLIPLHGLSPEWKPVTHGEEEFHPRFPGYIHSKNGPKQPPEALETIRRAIIADSNGPAMDFSFSGAPGDTNLFARIVRGEEEQWRIWENSTHVAFLTPFPNTPGFTVLVPRRHAGSDILELADADLHGLADAVYEVSCLLRSSLGVRRVGVIFEGFEIDYAHAKLVPIHESGDVACSLGATAYQSTYAGFVTSQFGPRVPGETLRLLRRKLGEIAH